jgi:NAD(P)-dependent dehydrogenase (short-subunit alcohol dehydrogenase family)
MGINMDGVVFGVHAALPVLRRRGGGSIVCTASMAGLTAVPFDPIYGANKHGVVGLVRALGPSLAPQNITINAFCPGFAETKIIGPIKEILQQSGVPIIPVEAAGEAVLKAFDDGETGQAYLLQAGLEPMLYKFRGIPGPKHADGSPATPAEPTGIPATPAAAEPPPAT